MLVVTIAGWAYLVRVSSDSGPSKHNFESEKPSAASARCQISRAACELWWSGWPMPTCCVPCPGNSHAVVKKDSSKASQPLRRSGSDAYERAAPRDTGAQRAHQYGVALLDATIAQRFVERDRNRSARRVAVALDVEHETLEWNVEALGDLGN